mmetsp:Transcript_21111/g.23497  ORF Transcript_21111/g.23497 Transcript_21111/m.23497 type:complete len:157 (-) Transcript_21111:62-532(-)
MSYCCCSIRTGCLINCIYDYVIGPLIFLAGTADLIVGNYAFSIALLTISILIFGTRIYFGSQFHKSDFEQEEAKTYFRVRILSGIGVLIVLTCLTLYFASVEHWPGVKGQPIVFLIYIIVDSILLKAVYDQAYGDKDGEKENKGLLGSKNRSDRRV